MKNGLKILREELSTLGGFLVFGLLSMFADALVPGSIGVAGNVAILLALFAVMLWCAFTAVHHAEALAHRVGEPFGTIILTLAVIIIEVALISAVMLTGEPSPAMARDTMMAVVMITMNLLVGMSILLGGIRYKQQAYNLDGANAYLAVLIPLAVFALILPRFTTSAPGGQASFLQSEYLIISCVTLYGIFLLIQTVTNSDIFREPSRADAAPEPTNQLDAHTADTSHSTAYYAIVMVVALLPIILLSKKLAGHLDELIMVTGAPLELSGLLVAILILTPEGLTAIKSAMANSLQKSVNLSLGSALASIGLTVPAVVTISLFTGQTLELGLDTVEIIMLVLTILVSIVTFGVTRTNVVQGAVHVALFLGYVMLIFDKT